MLSGFIESLENVTDYAEDVADILRLIAMKYGYKGYNVFELS